MHYSEQGKPFTGLACGKRCTEMNVKTSMGKVGDAYDNALAESFFASLACKLINRRS
jgi:putative transposase